MFSSIDADERTDASFRAQSQADHHNGVTPLLRIIPFINISSIFVLDSMHLLFQGIMKKLLIYWLEEEKNRLRVSKRQEASRRMQLLKGQFRVQFQRKPRSMKHSGKRKATNYRLFLLYAGPLVMKVLLSTKLLKHFLLLHVDSGILCSDKFCEKLRLTAKQYLTIFF